MSDDFDYNDFLPEPEPYVEPVAPAPTASAREWLKQWYEQKRKNPPQKPTILELEALLEKEPLDTVTVNPDGSIGVGVPEWQVEMLEAYASSQSEKLAGVGQQAAEEIQNVGNLHMEWGDQTYVEVAEIIDRVIAGRVKP